MTWSGWWHVLKYKMQGTRSCKCRMGTLNGTRIALSWAFNITILKSSTIPSKLTIARSLKSSKVQKKPFRTVSASIKNDLTDHSSSMNQFKQAIHSASKIYKSWGVKSTQTRRAKNTRCSKFSTRAANLNKYSCRSLKVCSTWPTQRSRTAYLPCSRS